MDKEDYRDNAYLKGYYCGRVGGNGIPAKNASRNWREAWDLGYLDGKGDLEDLGPSISMKTLDLRDPKIERAFLDWLRKNGVPVG